MDGNELKAFKELIEKEGSVKNLELRFQIEPGEIRTVLFSGVPIWWNNEECVLGLANDITELRKYEYEIARLDRLNLIGEMAASIAHEIRNPMTTVKGFLQLMGSQERYLEDQEYMTLMIEEMERANDIITEFLSLAKNKLVNLIKGNLNERLLTLMPLLQAEAIKKDISIKLEFEDIPYILFDEAELRQLVLNLVLNGIDAMSESGVIRIRTYKDSEFICMEVQDQGCGMPAEVLQQIGTPFYTTKNNGTGLGLAVCYSIAERHHAKMDVVSSSAGTVFKASFPQID